MTAISADLRRQVRARAGNCCEYCLLAEADHFLAHEIDHIIAEKHRGITHLDNLCLSCFDCNRNKGSDIGSVDLDTLALTPLFNPRSQRWGDHFGLNGSVIEPLTPEARVTIFMLRMNDESRLARRSALIELGRYPCLMPGV